MKKIGLLFAMMFCMVSAFSASFEAEVVSTTGKVEMLKDNQWVALKQGDKIAQGTMIQTGFKSEMSLKIKDSIVQVAPLTRMAVEKLLDQGSKDNTSLYVATGSVKSDVRHPEDRRVVFTVRSPVATASVRGTVVTVKNHFQSAAVMADRGIVAVWETPEDDSGMNLSAGAEAVAAEAQVAAAEQTNAASGDNAATSKSEDSKADATVDSGKKGGKKSGASESKAKVSAADDGAPAGTFTVSKSQGASFSSSGNVLNAQSVAQKNSTSVGSATVSAAAAEVIATATNNVNAASSVAAAANQASAAKKTGSLNVTVTMPSSTN